MSRISDFLKNNLLLVGYFLVIVLIAMGMIEKTGSSQLHYLVIYSVPLIVAYFAVKSTLFRGSVNFGNRINVSSYVPESKIAVFAFFLAVLFIVIHFIYLGEFPLIESFRSTDSLWIADYRNDLTGKSSALINYLNSFWITAVIPFFLLYFYHKGQKKLFVVFMIIASFYAINLLQKSFIVTIFLPLLCYKVIKREFISSAVILAFIIFSLIVLVFSANPDLRGKDTGDPLKIAQRSKGSSSKVDEGYGPVTSIIIGLGKRVAIIPGNIVSMWFEKVPEEKPFLNGCGYRFIAPFKDCEYRNYATELYPLFYPEYVERGYSGSVNGASFVYDYANFGRLGLVISGLFLGFILALVDWIYSGNILFKIALNFFPIFVLSSSALTTLLFSGGWALTILLYFFFNPAKSNNYK